MRTLPPRRDREGEAVERNLALEVVRVTEAAALSSARWMGLGRQVLAEHQGCEVGLGQSRV